MSIVKEIYTDGACRGPQENRIAGAGVFFGDDSEHNITVGVPLNMPQTNQVAELYAILLCLNKIIEIGDVNTTYKILSDSKYSIKCVTEWIHNWQKNNWKTSKKEPVKHKDLIKDIYEKLQIVNVTLEYVPGHSGVYGNEMADELATHACMP